MQNVLDRITELYIEHIPGTLAKCPRDRVLYAAFVPFLGFEAPEENAEHGRQIYILDTRRIDLWEKLTNAEERSLKLYAWGECIGGTTLEIESAELNELLLEWYSYQINQEESQELLDQIGGAIAKSCKALNERGWSGERFTDDFIVYTECVAGDTSSVGLAKCVTHDWLQVKRLEGMLLWA